nr:serine/threonine-protein kinase [Thermoanaerobaculia bacterium]
DLELPSLAEPELVAEPETESPFELVDLEIEPEPVAAEPEVAEEPAPAPAPAGSLASPDFAATQHIPVFDDSTLNAPGGERFGQYTLLERIAAGGMAEVWKARMRGVEGFQKTVAIKKILPHMTDNSEFIGMFIDEAKLAAQLSHPNIVHIYDLGKIGRDYYIAMEYVEGKDLRSLLNASRRKGMPLTLGLSLLIAARLASALDYAHRKRDFEGKELALVHRDVSPQNVLLTHEGDVKLCDFGIAKAVSKAGQTQMGSLKGKLQYMSPEQAWGRPVDARSDIFSLGAVLFEMLTGERLFSGDSEMSILEAVRHGRIRTPRDIDPSIPVEVDEIVTRALAYDVRDRFQSAGEMMQRIEGVLHTLVPSPGPGELAAYLARVTAPEPSSGDALFIPPPSPVAIPAHLPDPEVPPSLFTPELTPLPAEAAPVAAVTPLGDVHVEETGGRRSRLFLVVAIVVLLAAVIVTFFFLRGRHGGEAAPPAATGPAAQPAPAAPAPAQPVQPGAKAAPGTAPPAETIDVQAILKEELAKREKERRRKYEAQVQQLERELAKAQKDAQDKARAPEGQKPPSQETPARPPR